MNNCNTNVIAMLDHKHITINTSLDSSYYRNEEEKDTLSSHLKNDII